MSSDASRIVSSSLALAHISDTSQLSLPDLLDYELEHNPTFPLYVYAEDGSSNVTTISMLEFVRAAHRAGDAVRSDSQPGDVVAIVANIDALVYTALIVGIMKAGLVPFPISPRNSPTALLHLIRKSSAHRLLVTSSTLRGVLDGLDAEIQAVDPTYVLRVEEAPNLYALYPRLGRERAEDSFTPISQPSSPKDLDKGIYLHSSGSTGLPKPILFTHQIIKDNGALLFHRVYHESIPHPLMGAFGLPTFHMMGFSYQILMPLYGLVSTGMYAPTVTRPDATPIIATAETVLAAAKVVQPNVMTVVPSFLHVWSQSDEASEFLRTLVMLSYGGGPVAPRVGEALRAKGVNVHPGYGGTEFGVPTTLRTEFDSDWQYMSFSERANIRWVPQGDGTFEAQFLISDTHHVAVENISDVSGYATSDLWEPHPTKPNLWKIVGRIDDVLIHSSGEKTVPGPIEAVISASPIIDGVVMFGRQRDQPGVLLEPLAEHQISVNDDAEVSRFRNLIWPVIEEANKIAPAFSRIFKEMILIADSKKPLPRVGKGSVARKAAIAHYAIEIDKLYYAVESNMGADSVVPPESWDAENVQLWLVAQIGDIMSGASINPTVDLFEQGLDSLSATIVRLRLVGALRQTNLSTIAGGIGQNITYSYPTIEQLASHIVGLVGGTSLREKTHEELIEAMVSKYSEGLDAPVPAPASEIDTKRQYVLLTGSTGNLGAQMLASLLINNNVERVYALNRPSAKSSMLMRHRDRFHDKALNTLLLSSPKLVFLEGDTSHEGLGLPNDMLNELRQNLTMIIHNAWKLNFNNSLLSFESHIKGSRILMDLARSSRHSSFIRFLFTSSIGSTQSWDARSLGPYPEEVVMEAKYAVGGGYGESKYATERILANSGLRATSFRIGQVTGGENGAWATTDWVPILVKSSLSIGMLPDACGVVSWVPMNAVSDTLLDVGFTLEEAPIAVNVVHPSPVAWTSVMRNIRNNLIQERHLSSDSLPLVPYHDWIATIQKYAVNPTEKDSRNIPAVKLIDFFALQAAVDDDLRKNGQSSFESAALTPLSTENVQKLSERMRMLEPLDVSHTEKWVRYWINSGLL